MADISVCVPRNAAGFDGVFAVCRSLGIKLEIKDPEPPGGPCWRTVG